MIVDDPLVSFKPGQGKLLDDFLFRLSQRAGSDLFLITEVEKPFVDIPLGDDQPIFLTAIPEHVEEIDLGEVHRSQRSHSLDVGNGLFLSGSFVRVKVREAGEPTLV